MSDHADATYPLEDRYQRVLENGQVEYDPPDPEWEQAFLASPPPAEPSP